MHFIRIAFLAPLLFLSLLSCEEEQVAAAPVIEEETLINVLADIHMAEAALQALRGSTKDSMSQMYYEQVYEIHQVDSASVASSLEIMREQPERMKAVYDQVMERVEKMNALSKDPEARDK